jgi:hypothetical protein
MRDLADLPWLSISQKPLAELASPGNRQLIPTIARGSSLSVIVLIVEQSLLFVLEIRRFSKYMEAEK